MIRSLQPWWRAERHRHFLAYGSMVAAGIAAYFALPVEPRWGWVAGGFVAAIAASSMAWRKHPFLRPLLAALCLALLGMTWASYYTAHRQITVLDHALTPRPLSGTVRDVERTQDGLRITLDHVTITHLEPSRTPERVRLSMRLKQAGLTAFPAVGSRIELLAGLLPPMGPAMPHGFDFARYFFFRGIGAVGYGLPPWKLVETPSDQGVAERFANWRIGLTQRIIDTLGPLHGPIAAGLITGEDRAITGEDYDALKASNLYHIIAISGGHMVVISGMLFLLMRWLTLCLPARWRYRPQMKSWAAGATLILTTLYLFVTGLPVSAVRAYVMIALVLLAVILRRQVDPMRSLVIAALIMLARDPSDLFEPGFQLSFVATLAIIALVERMFLTPHGDLSHAARFWRLAAATFLISLVAEAATAPLVIAQFNMFSIYGVLANMVATPLVSLMIMPTVAVFFLLLPFGWDHPALWLLDKGIGALMGIAHRVAALPQAQHYIPSLPGWGVALFTIGLLWFCFWQRRPRWFGVPVMLIGVASIATVTPPDLLVGQEVKQIALRTPEGYVLARGRVDSMVTELWANGLGYKQLPLTPKNGEAWRCDRLGCVATIGKTRIAFPENATALLEDCDRSDAVVTTLRRVRCAHARVVDGWDLYDGGVHGFWIDPLRVENSAQWQGRRPWGKQPRGIRK